MGSVHGYAETQGGALLGGPEGFEDMLKHPKSSSFTDDSEDGESMKRFLKREAKALKQHHGNKQVAHVLKHQVTEQNVQPVVEHLTEATDADWSPVSASEATATNEDVDQHPSRGPIHHSKVLQKLAARFAKQRAKEAAIRRSVHHGASALSKMFKLGGHGAFRAESAIIDMP